MPDVALWALSLSALSWSLSDLASHLVVLELCVAGFQSSAAWLKQHFEPTETFGANRSMCASLPMELTRLGNEMLAPAAVFSTGNTQVFFFLSAQPVELPLHVGAQVLAEAGVAVRWEDVSQRPLAKLFGASFDDVSTGSQVSLLTELSATLFNRPANRTRRHATEQSEQGSCAEP